MSQKNEKLATQADVSRNLLFKKCLLPSVFNEGIIVSRVRLPAVDDDPHELVVLRDGDLLPGRPPGGPLGSAFPPLPAAVLTGHSGDGVWLHVQHPGELKQCFH